MRILGLDVGEKRIGVAISDPLGWTAQGLTTIQRSNSELEDIETVLEIVKKYQVTSIVVGLPRNMNGTYGPQTEYIKNFAEKLAQKTQVKIDFWDERLTTVAAERALLEADLSRKRRKKVVDKVAAVVILQNYLDCKSRIIQN